MTLYLSGFNTPRSIIYMYIYIQITRYYYVIGRGRPAISGSGITGETALRAKPTYLKLLHLGITR